jgi:F-type H+-transporting ATPase subunit a
MHISLAAEPVFHIGGFNVTNSLIASVITSLLLIIIGFFISKRLSEKPSRFRAIVEEMFIFIMTLAESIGGKYAAKFVPLVLTLFFFILVSNWLGLLPGFGSIVIEKVVHGEHESVPLLRGATADLNTTLALALISVFSIQYFGVQKLRLSYFKKFLDISSPVNFFVGVLETISEFAKIISFTFRLFGNVFAGEVLLAVVISLVPLIAPLPFFGLEIFVGFIQALVFAMLTLVFIHMATAGHGDDHAHDVNVAGKEVEYGN